MQPDTVPHKAVQGTPYVYDARIDIALAELREKVRQLRSAGRLSPEVLRHLRNFFRVKNIYHSNAIEGNLLNLGETRLVVEEGLTITGKPLKDSVEAKNLSEALDLFEALADRSNEPITGVDLRSIHAAILKGIDDDNAGKYRSVQVEISGSAFKPPPPESVAPAMSEFLDWVSSASVPAEDEEPVDPLVLACVAHTWCVYIHPFIDGNGRCARLLMNLILIRHGYPIAIVTRDDRERYYAALEESQASDLTPFIALIEECVNESFEEYNLAASEQRDREEWARSIVKAMGEKDYADARNEYKVWRSAMDLLKSYFQQTVYVLNEQEIRDGIVRVFFQDFGTLEFEKYLALRNGGSAKRTWFFRVDFRAGQRTARYLFWFGHASLPMLQSLGKGTVTLFLAQETTPFEYERLDITQDASTPDLVEVAYIPEQEQFLCRFRNGVTEPSRVERFGREFIEQVIARRF